MFGGFQTKQPNNSVIPLFVILCLVFTPVACGVSDGNPLTTDDTPGVTDGSGGTDNPGETDNGGGIVPGLIPEDIVLVGDDSWMQMAGNHELSGFVYKWDKSIPGFPRIHGGFRNPAYKKRRKRGDLPR